MDSSASPDTDAEQVRARVAWYYFIGGLTQKEIADKVGITRLRVNRIIGQVRGEGLVHTTLRLPLADCIELQEQLRRKFALEEVVVIPALDDPDENRRLVGEAAGTLLNNLLTDGKGIGVGWGRTLSAAAKRMTHRSAGSTWVATLMGGLTRGSGINTFEVATEFARNIGGECYYLTAPIYCPSPESRETLMTHDGLIQSMRRARGAHYALVSSGDLTEKSLLASTQTVVESVKTLKRAGAVGDLLGIFLDEQGNPVAHELNERVIALDPAGLRAIPKAILASGGQHKVKIVRAILLGGYVKWLVTDQKVASSLLR
ncbi:MAG: sugar-binding transcriptional regulator [Rhizobiales bacterium]|nr:sugar-binding transcriptional regulator [Hyphomicrobiales bacterium]